MRSIALIIFALLMICSCGRNARKQADSSDINKKLSALMKFEKQSEDFGNVSEGEKIILFYTFENAGSKDLVIYEALPSCGCVSAKYDNSPVKPGEKRDVEVTFDSEGWSGIQHKSLTFKTNGIPNYTTILVTGTVN